MEKSAGAAIAPLGLSTIGQIALSVTDLDRAVAFYRDTLGMRMLFQVPNLAFFDCSGIRLMLSASQAPAAPSSTVIYFSVPEIQPAFAAIQARHTAIESEPHMIARMPDHELWIALFRDPDGNLLALMSQVPAPPV